MLSLQLETGPRARPTHRQNYERLFCSLPISRLIQLSLFRSLETLIGLDKFDNSNRLCLSVYPIDSYSGITAFTQDLFCPLRRKHVIY